MVDGGMWTGSALVEGWTVVGSLTVASMTLGILALLIYYAYPTWKVRHIPVPPYWWGIGHLPLLNVKSHHAFIFTTLARKYGPVYRFHLGRHPAVMVADADLSRQVSLYKCTTNRSNPAMVQGTLLQSAIFFSRDEQWIGMKNTLLPLYHSQQLHAFKPLMSRCIANLVSRLSQLTETEDINIARFLQRLTMDVIGEAAFGTKFGLLDEKPGSDDYLVQTAVNSIDSYRIRMEPGAQISTVVGTYLPFLLTPLRLALSQIPGSAEWRAAKSDKGLTTRLNEITDKRALQTKEALGSKIDALSLLLNSSRMTKENKKLLTREYITACTYEMLLVGSETTSVTLSYAIYLLALNPRAEKKMLEEIDAFGPPNSTVEPEDLETKFPYVAMVYKESMRVLTTTPVLAREAAEDIEVGQYRLPKGTWVWLAVEAMHMNPKYFPDPEEFRPERFHESCEEQKKRHPYAFSPFGVGPRSCPGRKFAWQEAMLALIGLYQNFTFSLSPLTEVPLLTHFGLVVRPKNGVNVRVHKRH